MKSFVFAVIGLGLLLASPAIAQETVVTPAATCPTCNEAECTCPQPTIVASQSIIEPTSEMWFYEQERRDRLDPALALRRIAEAKAAQRRARLAAMKWFGYSNLRPTVSPDPVNGYYSPFWAGNNRLSPYMWSGYGHSTVVVRPAGLYR